MFRQLYETKSVHMFNNYTTWKLKLNYGTIATPGNLLIKDNETSLFP